MHLPEQILLRPSPSLAVALGIIHLGATGCLLPLTLAIWIKLVLGAVLLGSLVETLRCSALLRAAGSITELKLHQDGTLGLSRRDGRRQFAEVAAQTAVLSFLAAITFKVPGERRARAVVIMPDMVSAAEFRRLKVWLRWRTAVSRGAA